MSSSRTMVGLALAISCAPAPLAPHPHFYQAGAPLSKLETAWRVLEPFFGNALPPRINVEYESTGPSHFDPRTNTIHLVVSSYRGEPEVATVAHESCHLALAVLTRGASTEEGFRFLDEGLATVMQYEAIGIGAQRGRVFRAHTARRLERGRATIAAMERWSEYFGDPTHPADYTAYEDAAAFVRFLADTYGETRLRSLFVDIGTTRSLASSLPTATGHSLAETELLWEEYARAP